MAHGEAFRAKAEWEKRLLRHLLAWSVRLLLLIVLPFLSLSLLLLLSGLDDWAAGALADGISHASR